MNNKKALSSGIWYTVSNILLRAVSIITAPIFTRLLSTSDYGIVSNFTSWQNIVSIVTSLCLSYSIGRAKIDFSEKFNEYMSAIQGLSTIVSLFFLFLVIIFLQPLSDFMEIDDALLISLSVYMIFFPSIEYTQSKFRFEYRYKENIAIAAYTTLMSVVVSLLLVVFSILPGYVGRIEGTIIPSIILALICWLKIFKSDKTFINMKYWTYALRISLPMIPHSLAMVILGQIDRIMIVKLVGASEAGIYSFGYSYAIVASIVVNAVGQAWQPWLYDQLYSDNYSEIRRINRLLNSLISVVILFFIAVAPEAIKILGSEAFWEAEWMVAPVAIGTYYQYIYNNFSQVELYTKKTVWIAVGSVLAAGINYILNILFIPIWGYVAAAYTTMIGYLLLMIFHWIFSYISYGRFIYEAKNIFLNFLVTTLVGMLICLNYKGYFMRYLLLLIVSCIEIFIYRKQIISIKEWLLMRVRR